MDPHGAAAALDIGSNSAHLLVAGEEGVRTDESVFLGMGERVAADGLLGTPARAAATTAIAGLVERAHALGAADAAILLLGTEPVRRAADAGRLAAELEAATGVPLHVLTHEEEAWLNALGVTQGHRLASPLVVIDGGGGSTEVALVRPDGAHLAVGLRLGTASLTATHVRSDPPAAREYDALLRAARATTATLPDAGALDGAAIVMVGGTASNLVKAIPVAREDRRLTRTRLDALRDELLSSTAVELGARYLLNPRRAPLMTSGLAIVVALLEALGADELLASEASLREGALLALGRAGAGWRDALPQLLAGWR